MKNLGQRSRDLDIVVKEDIYKHITVTGSTGTLSSSDLATILASPEKVVINNNYFFSSSDTDYLYYNSYGKGTNTRIFIYTKRITKSSGFYKNIDASYYCGSSAVQLELVSGTNIKTINNESVLGSGNISVSGGTPTTVKVDGTSITSNNEADLKTINSNYNASSNKLATASDLPTVNNPTITFTQGGTTKGTITLNQSSDQTIALDAGGGAGVTLRRWS